MLKEQASYGLAYVIHVFADDGLWHAGCGAAGRTVSFKVGSQAIATTAPWDDDQVLELDLQAWLYTYLPLVNR